MLDFQVLNSTMTNPTLWSVSYAFLLTFVLGTVIAVLYVRTFQGLSYSRNFLHSLILCPLIVAIAMQAIGDNMARGIGMMGALSLLRFRTNIKDPRDMFFIFASLTVGLAAGVHAYGIATLGTLFFVLTTLILAKSPFSHGTQFDGLLRFNSTKDSREQQHELEIRLQHLCKNVALVSIREVAQGDRLDYAYQVKLKRGTTNQELVSSLSGFSHVRGLNLMMQESIIEV